MRITLRDPGQGGKAVVGEIEIIERQKAIDLIPEPIPDGPFKRIDQKFQQRRRDLPDNR
jgi:hypothetical protein